MPRSKVTKKKKTRAMRSLLRRVRLIYEIERERSGQKRLTVVQGLTFVVQNGRR
jgi:hypothetical protein